MSAPASHGPQFSRVVARRYGKYDFNRFDHLVQRSASLGNASIGKVHVDCKFLFKKSKWGVFATGAGGPGELANSHQDHSAGQDSPAGIIYLDLSFDQPKECRLRSATVLVTLDDDDQDLKRQFPSDEEKLPVQIMTYGPRHIFGESKHELKRSKARFTPTVGAGGMAELGGMGRESEKTKLRECRWDFTTDLRANAKSKDNPWAYKVLSWHLTENELDTQSMHDNIVHTGFSFTHGGQPFFMKVEVSGKLESTRADLKQRAKTKLRKLKFSPNPLSGRYATTLIHIDDHVNYKTPLNGLMLGLGTAMERENGAAPVEHGTSGQSQDFATAATTSPGRPHRPPAETPEARLGPEVEEYKYQTRFEAPPSRPSRAPNLTGQSRPTDDPTAPTIENLAEVSQLLLSMPSAPTRRSNFRRSRESEAAAAATAENNLGREHSDPWPSQGTTGFEYHDTTDAPSTPVECQPEELKDPDPLDFELIDISSVRTGHSAQNVENLSRATGPPSDRTTADIIPEEEQTPPINSANGVLYPGIVVLVQMWVLQMLVELVTANGSWISAA